MVYTTKFFKRLDEVKSQINKLYKIYQAQIFAEYQQAQGKLWIVNPIYIAKYHNNLFEYINQKYLIN